MELSKTQNQVHHAFFKDNHRCFTAMRQKGWSPLFIVLLLLATIIIIFTIAHFIFAQPKKPHRAQEMTVVATQAKKMDVPVFLNALGTVIPTETITVKTQVNGVLEKVLFKEGAMIKKGDLLARIDPRPYEAQLQEFEGQLAKDEALLANAKIDLSRYQTLWKEDSVSKQTLDTQASLVSQLEGTVKADQGLVNNARVNLSYTYITSPINGRLGLRLVDPGNFVQTTDTTGLFVINNIRPITTIFTIAQDDVPQVIKQIKVRKQLMVEAYDRMQNNMLAKGTLFALDNQIDPTTGTLKLKAQFSNRDDALFPNQFVNIKLMIDKLQNAIVIPTSAILHSTQGDYVYVLNANKTIACTKPIETTYSWADNTVVKSGIIETDFVVVEGTDKLVNGAHVKLDNKRQEIQTNIPPAKKLKSQQK